MGYQINNDDSGNLYILLELFVIGGIIY